MQVRVGAGSAVLWSHVDLGVEALRHGGVSLLTGGLLGVERHFGTFDDDVVDFILFPPRGVKLMVFCSRHQFRMYTNVFKHRLNYLLECFHVLLHAVVGPQVGHKVARVHAVEAVEEGVDAGMQMD